MTFVIISSSHHRKQIVLCLICKSYFHTDGASAASYNEFIELLVPCVCSSAVLRVPHAYNSVLVAEFSGAGPLPRS